MKEINGYTERKGCSVPVIIIAQSREIARESRTILVANAIIMSTNNSFIYIVLSPLLSVNTLNTADVILRDSQAERAPIVQTTE